MPPFPVVEVPSSRRGCARATSSSSTTSPCTADILRANGARFLFLPPYSPDLTPIEMAFSKLKAHLRRIGARTLDALLQAAGEICGLFDPGECRNYFREARYVSD
jgi:transposase